MPRKRWALPASLLSLLLLAPVTALTSSAAASPVPAAPVAAAAATVPLDQLNTVTTQVAFGLRRPVAIAAPRDGSNRLFIVEKRGTVRVYHPDTGLAADPIINITAAIDESGNERGLLGIAFASDFAQTQDVYLAYTALPDGAVTVARYRLDDGVLEPLLAQEHAEFSNHNGGQITFGPDGYLYLSIGDGGGAADPLDSAQRLDTLLGKIVRIDVRRSCGALAYCVPASNPFVGVAGARPEIWMYGGRNPWKFSFDYADGSMWIGDVGQGRWEEINHVKAGQQAGANLGWSCFEGLEVFDQTQCRDGEDYTMPVLTYSPWTGGCAVIGGEVYRGQQFDSLVGGTYIATDYCSNTVWAMRPNGLGGYAEAEIGEMPTQVTAFASTQQGEFYVVNDLPGGLHRVGFERIPPLCSVRATTQRWGTGMNVNLTLTNTGTTTINAWTLTFPLPLGQTITADWNTNLTQGGPIVNASNAEHNGTIAPGRSVSLSYQVRHTGQTATPSRFTLNERSCALVR